MEVGGGVRGRGEWHDAVEVRGRGAGARQEGVAEETLGGEILLRSSKCVDGTLLM